MEIERQNHALEHGYDPIDEGFETEAKNPIELKSESTK
jgi:hypothetical protein